MHIHIYFCKFFYISSYIYNIILNHFENLLQKNNARQTKFMKIYTKTKQVFMIISIYTIYIYLHIRNHNTPTHVLYNKKKLCNLVSLCNIRVPLILFCSDFVFLICNCVFK